MGGEAYWYFVDSTERPERALSMLQRREFEAGRFFPATSMVGSRFDSAFFRTTYEHDFGSIDEALEASEEQGTRSILDVIGIASDFEPGYCAAFDSQDLDEWFGTQTPPRVEIETRLSSLIEGLDRGDSRYLPIFDAGTLRGYLFLGMSYD